MPHVDYDAVRASLRRRVEPLTFTLGGHLFTTRPAPSLGDTFDLLDVPDPVPENEAAAARGMCRFIRSMLIEGDRAHFDQVLYGIGSDESPLLIQIGLDLVAQYQANRPTVPSDSSPSGSPSTGKKRARRSGGEVSRARH